MCWFASSLVCISNKVIFDESPHGVAIFRHWRRSTIGRRKPLPWMVAMDPASSESCLVNLERRRRIWSQRACALNQWKSCRIACIYEKLRQNVVTHVLPEGQDYSQELEARISDDGATGYDCSMVNGFIFRLVFNDDEQQCRKNIG